MSEADSSLSFDDNIKRFYSFWQQISDHYKNYPPEVYFDILNEPNMEMGAQLWNELIAKSLKIIRKSNPTRTVLVGTPNLGQSWTIGLLDLPKDDWNLIVQVHYYLPHLFTHQGLAYAHAEASKGMQWAGTPEEKEPIISDFNFCAKWSKDHYRPINLGEFGVNEYADLASRARYLTFIRQLADQNDFSFHVWAFREIFRVFDEETGKWQQPIVDALIPAKH
jgi:endoglucanase